MKKELARKLLPLVNDREAMAQLEQYSASRIEFHRDQLEVGCGDVWSLRGAISELRRFKTLREEVLAAAE